ncbi:regucalcin-like [Galleria mellonella]|uniref:Regucalcin n=1 Tax=Galleria mellonella TaxID=7137 RepID=A0ABM3MTW7_GALME|nr:regucalcin-like [Galleria mellonella]
MSVKIQKITEPLLLGEGPHWDERQQALFFVSISEKTLNKYVLATGRHTRTKLEGHVAFIIPVEGAVDQYVVGFENKFVIMQWDGEDGTPVRLVRELADLNQYTDAPTQVNDGKADPRGRLFAGTLLPSNDLKNFEPKGSLYRLDGTTVTKLCDGIKVSNGLAWDLKEKAMYYIDSLENNIRRYDYNVETGEISNLKYVFDFNKHNIEGFPDGTTIDTDGNLWVAVFNGSCVIKVDPRTGQLLEKVAIPAPQVTSATFGGPNYDILFVTTGSINMGSEQAPPAGSTFMVTGLGVKGHPNINVKL